LAPWSFRAARKWIMPMKPTPTMPILTIAVCPYNSGFVNLQFSRFAWFWQPDLHPIPGCDGKQLIDLLLRRRRSNRRALWHWHSHLEEHILKAGRGHRDEHLSRPA